MWLRVLSDLGPDTVNLYAPQLPKPTKRRLWQALLGPPVTQWNEKSRLQRRPEGRCCMRDLDIRWSWGIVIYGPPNQYINPRDPPPLYIQYRNEWTRNQAACAPWPRATVPAAWKSDCSFRETNRSASEALPPPPPQIKSPGMPIGHPPTPALITTSTK